MVTYLKRLSKAGVKVLVATCHQRKSSTWKGGTVRNGRESWCSGNLLLALPTHARAHTHAHKHAYRLTQSNRQTHSAGAAAAGKTNSPPPPPRHRPETSDCPRTRGCSTRNAPGQRERQAAGSVRSVTVAGRIHETFYFLLLLPGSARGTCCSRPSVSDATRAAPLPSAPHFVWWFGTAENRFAPRVAVGAWGVNSLSANLRRNSCARVWFVDCYRACWNFQGKNQKHVFLLTFVWVNTLNHLLRSMKLPLILLVDRVVMKVNLGVVQFDCSLCSVFFFKPPFTLSFPTRFCLNKSYYT